MKTRLVVNPAAAGGAMVKRWPRIEERLRALNFPFEAVFTERRGHATLLARAALDAGFDLIVAVGGDGTVNEVLNGLVVDGKAIQPAAALGIITSGTGGDFARTAGLPRDMLAAAEHLARATGTRPFDVGEIVHGLYGQEQHRYFANVAGMGFDAEVIERLESGGKRGSGTIPYLMALVRTVTSFRNKDVKMEIDGRVVQSRFNSVIVCNGQYFGGGMQVGPHAALDDGLFDIVTLGDFSVLEILIHTPKIYNGSHLSVAKVGECRAQSVAVESRQRMLIEADGELIGSGPARFRILPAALNLWI